jgi:hypothetical protein
VPLFLICCNVMALMLSNPGMVKSSVADPDPNPDPVPLDPHVFGPPIRIRIYKSEVWIRILLSSCKNSKKNLDSCYFVILFDFLSLKKDVNVPSKSNKLKKKNYFSVGILKVYDENSRIRNRIH